jgi:hypothetical protein
VACGKAPPSHTEAHVQVWLPLPRLQPTEEQGPGCVIPKLQYCFGRAQSFRARGTLLNGSYIPPAFADVNG